MSLRFLISKKRTFPYETKMRSCVVQKKDNSQKRLFEEIVNGNYPSRAVNKMNGNTLENFVLRLVEFTSVKMGAKSKSDLELLNWWPWPGDVSNYKSNKKDKDFRGNLKKVVIDCCALFRGFNEKWLPRALPWVNDENFDIVQVKAEKRKAKVPQEVPPNKKRKTLLPTITKEVTSEPYISISRYNSQEVTSPKPVNQTEFLNYFELSLNNNDIPKATQVPNNSRVIRLQNCPHVPFSSNVGQLLMKKENCSVPDNVTERKIDRIEWYINRESPNPKTVQNLNYETSYVPNKNYTEHDFRFPKRQYHQVLGNRHYTKYIYGICKPLDIDVENDDLVELKAKYDKLKMKVKVNKLSAKQLKKYVCKEAKIVIEKKKINTKSDELFSKVAKVTLRNKQVSKNAKIVLERSNLKNAKTKNSATRKRR